MITEPMQNANYFDAKITRVEFMKKNGKANDILKFVSDLEKEIFHRKCPVERQYNVSR
jgi:hypothetical protein